MANFHEGEIAVQKQAGVTAMANRVGSGIHPFIFDAAAEFLFGQPLVIVASRDSKQQVRASLVSRTPGFIQLLSPAALRICQLPHPDDPLAGNLQPGNPLGLLAIDFESRLRLRVNGIFTQHTSDALYIEAQEVYGNCQKYIQARTVTNTPTVAPQPNGPVQSFRGSVLTPEQQSWIAQADTFFIASAHPGSGADVSHRGGNPGFVRVINERELIFPDYSGNMMFNTLGNITVNPLSGLLFLDFESGRTLQVTGRAAIVWDHDRITAFPGAKRLLTFEISEAIENRGGLGLRFGTPEYSHFNPR